MVKAKKVAYFAHLEECLNKYPRAFLVDADFVGSKQISDIRIALRGKVKAAHMPSRLHAGTNHAASAYTAHR